MNQPPVYSFATSIRGAGIKPTYQQAPGPGNYDVIDPQVPPRKSEYLYIYMLYLYFFNNPHIHLRPPPYYIYIYIYIHNLMFSVL